MNFNTFLGFQKNKYFLGYGDFVDIFWGRHKICLYLGSFLCILGSFIKGNAQNGGYFFGVDKIFDKVPQRIG